jgi:hypothetical protein
LRAERDNPQTISENRIAFGCSSTIRRGDGRDQLRFTTHGTGEGHYRTGEPRKLSKR